MVHIPPDLINLVLEVREETVAVEVHYLTGPVGRRSRSREDLRPSFRTGRDTFDVLFVGKFHRHHLSCFGVETEDVFARGEIEFILSINRYEVVNHRHVVRHIIAIFLGQCRFGLIVRVLVNTSLRGSPQTLAFLISDGIMGSCHHSGRGRLRIINPISALIYLKFIGTAAGNHYTAVGENLRRVRATPGIDHK